MFGLYTQHPFGINALQLPADPLTVIVRVMKIHNVVLMLLLLLFFFTNLHGAEKEIAAQISVKRLTSSLVLPHRAKHS